MRKYVIYIIPAVFALSASICRGEDFLGAPVISGGKTVVSQTNRLEKLLDMGYQDAVKYYQNALKSHENVKFWDRTTETYIEDHSNRPWHSITISKEPEGTKVVMIQDNWAWIIGTLVIRFVAVFAVLMVLYIAMSLSGVILSRIAAATEAKK
ncbi:MAG: hypothetical protein V1792_02355 [Pseudomonadota bacterium]